MAPHERQPPPRRLKQQQGGENDNNKKNNITTLIFDVDDTLYDIGTGFTAHRNGEGAQRFMVEYLQFPSMEAAKQVRDEYFARYHATAKGLLVAQAEGRLPEGAAPFDPKDLAQYWATHLDFGLLKNENLVTEQEQQRFVKDLKECQLNLVAFSNGSRQYVKRVLMELGLWELFGEDRLFAVEDVLPFCKPEREAFEVVLDKVGVKAEECVMVEDSMKNIRKAKELGLKTILVTGLKSGKSSAAADAGEATKPGDAPDHTDSAVNVSIEAVHELRSVLPGLWETPAVFDAEVVN